MDYGSGPYTVAFPAGTTRVLFDIPISNKDIYEGNENFMLTIDPTTLPNDVSVSTTGQALVNIINDDCK